jgi:hypothetical protein
MHIYIIDACTSRVLMDPMPVAMPVAVPVAVPVGGTQQLAVDMMIVHLN